MASDYIDTALITYALAASAITDIFSTRVYHIKAPQNAPRPYTVLSIPVPDNETETFDDDDYGQPLVQWTCVSDDEETPAVAFLGAHAIMDTFRNFSGSMDGVQVDYISDLRGPREINLPQSQDITCIVEFMPHYVEP